MTKILYTWGKGKTGNTCHNGEKKIPTPPSVLVSLNLNQLSLGCNHSAAIVNGECLMWGEVMGRRHTTLFKIVWKKTVISVSCGTNHTLLLTDDTRVFSMGLNGAGQLGVDIIDSAVPLPINVLNRVKVTQIVAGNQISAAITANGQLYTWGTARYGQLANGRRGEKHQSTPTIVLMPIDSAPSEHIQWKKVAFGEQHTVALAASNAVYAWGMNGRGQLGLGHCNDKLVPVKLNDFSNGSGIKDVTAGGYHSAALTTDGYILHVGSQLARSAWHW
ncbi:hypothetical protein SAMD00019534_096660 [Acytostelium subglobosum LB1]|uniref:hypothetical protein n=1 Tax=Acytostelium subglobosum LB1 TaxID=1410327 RepID=UPI000644F024|nr:hypothetical protein SAMD00019534_096660 [Acytostelium subglobosum LB1]GAM26491.1 hypothetical protein SAMD00019534_096660 [Acytostelium subglobosum LB1]|eukprot:XP_012750587.1 hypothetical protein SAMD00019534_096660 [Acytostelium subglobosum LB1]